MRKVEVNECILLNVLFFSPRNMSVKNFCCVLDLTMSVSR